MKNIEFGEPQYAVAMEAGEGSRGVSEKEILEQFSKKEQKEIKYKQRVLSSLAYFIGKDFEIPVELNQPGGGWHWNFKDNKIGIDPKDLLEKPLDYLRYLICHEGSHRRISRTDFIPLETWQQPGFSYMMNAIEDPRVDNFVAENYPKFKEFSRTFHDMEIENLESKYKEEAKEKLGHQPRFIQAGFEYLRLWYKETQGQAGEISKSLPREVQQVVQKTIASARDSWWRYPLKGEADSNDDLIKNYAKVSYEINLDEVWPEFKKLVDEDMKDQNMQESLKDMQSREQQEGKGQGVPQQLKDQLTPQQQKELEDAIDKAIEEAKKEREKNKGKEGKEEGEPKEGSQAGEGEPKEGSEKGEGQPREGQGGKPIDLDSLSEGLKQKIKEFIDSLPPEKKRELQQRAEKKIKELEKEINEELGGKLSDNPEKKAERGDEDKDSNTKRSGGEPVRDGKLREEPLDLEGLKIYKERLIREVNKNANVYEEYRMEILPIAEKLEIDLREIFLDRRASRWQGGFKTGKRIDIKTRIQEKAKGISAVESKAWQKRELPKEKDYAISLLVDLSGSMRKDGKIQETFKAVIVLAEVLNRLGINVEILGFNDEIYEYQKFGEPISREIREHMGGMLKEVEDSCCKNCGGEHNETDLGWATKIASERLALQKAENKFIITLTDGKLEESSKHPRSEYELGKTIDGILKETNLKPVGLGVGRGTENVSKYYPNSVISQNVKEMAEKLADTIREMIVNYQNF